MKVGKMNKISQEENIEKGKKRKIKTGIERKEGKGRKEK